MLKRKKTLCSKKQKGQSTIEYIILVAAIIAVILFFLRPSGPFAKQYQDTLNEGTQGMLNMAGRLSTSHVN